MLACLCVGAAFFISRTVEIRKVASEDEWLPVQNRVLADSLDSMEQLWRHAVENAARHELKIKVLRRSEYAKRVVGVRQVSYFDGSRVEHKVIESPVPERQDFALTLEEVNQLWPEGAVGEGETGQWMNRPGEPLRYLARLSEHKVVVFLLSPAAAHKVVEAELNKLLKPLPDHVPAGAYVELRDQAGELLFSSGRDAFSDAPADELVRHYSIFGEWSMRYWAPREKSVDYNAMILMSGSVVALIILFGGFWMIQEQEKAIKLAEARVSFVNAVSHELRTPLTNILLTVDVVQDKIENVKLKSRMDLIREESHRLGRLVDNVLDFARIEQGQMTVEKRDGVDLASLLASCVQQFQPAYNRKQIEMLVDVPDHKVIRTDPDLLVQIVLNLLSNIDKYAGNVASASIRVRYHPENVVIVVRDDGPGIPLADRSRIFRAFERMDERVAAGVTGTGLGLAISRELARQLGGDLVMIHDSEDEQSGAAFQLSISIVD